MIRLPLHIGLVHYPVVDRQGKIVATSTVSYDLHDLARLSRTFHVASYYVITPLRSQILLAERLMEHWLQGFGATYNSNRKEALELIRIQPSIQAAVADLSTPEERPVVIATSAKRHPNAISFEQMREDLWSSSRPHLLLFGTGWGMAPEALSAADFMLEPIEGFGAYNHLSVRTAAAIILDRLVSQSSPTSSERALQAKTAPEIQSL